MTAKTKTLLMNLGRAVIGAALALALIYWTLKSTDSNLWGALAQAKVGLLAAALLLFGGVLAIGAARWRLLLAVQGIHLTFRRALRLTLVGMFFNIVIPGSVSGDLVKMAYIMREAPSRKTEATLTIVLDRLIGILGLFIVAGIMVMVCLRTLLELEEAGIRGAIFLVGLGSMAGLTGVVLIEMRQRLLRLRWVAAGAAALTRRLPAAGTALIGRLDAALLLCRQRRRAMLGAIALAVAVHVCLGFQLWIIGRSLSETQLRARDYFLTTQIGNAVAGIPLTPGGVGTRDFVTKTLFEAFGATPGKTGVIPVTLSLIIVFWGLAGAAVFAVSATRRETAEAVQALSDSAPPNAAGPPTLSETEQSERLAAAGNLWNR